VAMSDNDYFRQAEREMFPKMAGSAVVVSLLTGTPDAKICLELGAALLFDKPILLVTIGDRFEIPERVRRLAADAVHLDEDESMVEGPGAERLIAALERLLPDG
jgi:hypothetical protein